MLSTACALAVALAGASPRTPARTCPAHELLEGTANAEVAVIDRLNKVALIGAPGAAAAAATATLLHLGGRYNTSMVWGASHGVALNADDRLQAYRTKVFEREDDHSISASDLPVCDELCNQPGWQCLMLVREPDARILDAFLRTARVGPSPAEWPELAATVGNETSLRRGLFSYRTFVSALAATARARQGGGGGGAKRARGAKAGGLLDYVLPQTTPTIEQCLLKARKSASPTLKFVPLHAYQESVRAALTGELDTQSVEALVSAAGAAAKSIGLVAPARSAVRRSSQRVLPRPGAGAKRRLAAGAPPGAGAARAASKRLGRLGHNGFSIVDVPAALMCGAGPRGFAEDRSGAAHCRPVHGIPPASRFHASDLVTSARAACLYRRDSALYLQVLCAQRWLLDSCSACKLKCARISRRPGPAHSPQGASGVGASADSHARPGTATGRHSRP